MTTAHSKLGASGADRWMTCPGSVKLTEGMPDTPSEYAEEGTRAHELAELCLAKSINADEAIGEYSKDMREHVQGFLDRVRADVALHPGAVLLVEQRVDYTEWVPDGFGTADVLILAERRLILRDLKYGQGVQVYATGNQLPIYALGALQAHELSYDWDEVELIIDQPRLDHEDRRVLRIDDLRSFGEQVRGLAELALSDNAPFNPSDKACRWCRAKAICRARAQANLRTAIEDFGPTPQPAALSLADLAALLPQLDEIAAWTKEVQEYALLQALAGHMVPGFKVVAGRSVTRWREGADKALTEHDALFVRKLVGITEAKKVLGKDNMILDDWTEKPQGKPTLVPEADRRKPLKLETAQADFND